MVEKLYETFDALYSDLPGNSRDKALTAEHALAQEAEVYEKSTKMTYRNVNSSVLM